MHCVQADPVVAGTIPHAPAIRMYSSLTVDAAKKPVPDKNE
jgi:hypothetical protein